jgi:hypothetical protein
MSIGLKPTPLPEDLREALRDFLDRTAHDAYFDVMTKLRDERLLDAREVVRRHLVGITLEADQGEDATSLLDGATSGDEEADGNER